MPNLTMDPPPLTSRPAVEGARSPAIRTQSRTVGSTAPPSRVNKRGVVSQLALSFLLCCCTPALSQEWTYVPDWDLDMQVTPADLPAPELQIRPGEGAATLSWPAFGSNFVLETAASCTPPLSWSLLSASAAVVGEETQVTVPATSAGRFFRLKGPYRCRIPLFEFAIFYGGLLEFTWAGPLVVGGRAHANGDIFAGSSSPLSFSRLVTTSGRVYLTNWDSHTVGEFTGTITYHGLRTNCPALYLPIGTNHTPEALREIINPPPPGEDAGSALGQQRYFNKAGLVLLVSNQLITCTLKTRANDPAPATIVAHHYATNAPYDNPANFGYANMAEIRSNFPFLSLTNGTVPPELLSFYDRRENKTVWPVQIDVGRLGRWLATNSLVAGKFPSTGGVYVGGVYPNIMYVADFRTQSELNLPAVRLVNAASIPTNSAPSGQPTGFTLVTPNPLYLWGHYNLADYPASLVCDALTVLSSHWNDSTSFGLFVNGAASATTNNAAVLAGTVYSTGPSNDTFSGGVMNLPRLLEDWGNGSSNYLALNTSLVNLFPSGKATNQFRIPGYYYYAPSRVFSLDRNFTNRTTLPPGTPELEVILPAWW